MISPYGNEIDVGRLLNLQKRQHADVLSIQQTVSAGQTVDASVNVSSEGHFVLLAMTGSFTTLSGGADVGTNILDIQLLSSDGNKELFNSFVPADLVLSPGRVRDAATAGDASNPLELEYRFMYTFRALSNIIVRVRSRATADDNTINIAFKGIRISADVG